MLDGGGFDLKINLDQVDGKKSIQKPKNLA